MTSAARLAREVRAPALSRGVVLLALTLAAWAAVGALIVAAFALAAVLG